MTVTVTLEGRPAPGFRVEYFDGERTVSGVTNRDGVVLFRAASDLSKWDLPWRLTASSEDFVLRNLTGGNTRWKVQAVRSASWRHRTHLRPCDEWYRVIDIPRGSLPLQSAEEYDAWYDSLSAHEKSNCEFVAKLVNQIGSKAAWYLYEFKAMPPTCVDGKKVPELDWTGWYRRLLEEATGASPGVCVADWERWWTSRGYPTAPDQPGR